MRNAGSGVSHFFAIACVLVIPASVMAQELAADFWETDGPVHAIARSGGTVYIGGEFTYVGPATGPWAAADTADASVLFRTSIGGSVLAAAPDGSGGWFLGIEDDELNTVRVSLTHIRADGSASDRSLPVDGRILALTRSGSALYIGGSFVAFDGQPRNSIAALDVDTATLLPWDPGANSAVYALAVEDSTLYLGGAFTSLAGQPRNRLGAFDTRTGDLTPWAPEATSTVSTIAARGSSVYAGGGFTTIGGESRAYLAALDASTGAVTPWSSGLPRFYFPSAFAITDSTLYVGGAPPSFGGIPPDGFIAALESATGALRWIASANRRVEAVVVGRATVYAAGAFDWPRRYVLALSASTGALEEWDPKTSGPVHVLALSGPGVYVGGSFTSIGGRSRTCIAALDASTGKATAWDPAANAVVEALVVSGATLYAGGGFTHIGGQARNRIAALDASTGVATAWDPNANGDVYALAVGPSAVFAGGWYTTIGGQPRQNIAALDTQTGLATPWSPGADSPVNALALNGSTLYAGGRFLHVGGEPRDHLAALSVAGPVLPWRPRPNFAVQDLSVGGTTVFAAGEFTLVEDQNRPHVAALDGTTGELLPWNPEPSGQVLSIALNGSVLYVGGTFDRIAGQQRSCLAALDVVTGSATRWDPGANGSVEALWADGSTVYAGGRFTVVAGQRRRGLAAIADTLSVDVELFDLSARQEAADVTLRWRTGRETDIRSFRVLRSSGGAAFIALSPDVVPSTAHTYTFQDIQPPPGPTVYRVAEVTERGLIPHGWVELEILDVRQGMTFLEGATPNPFHGETSLHFVLGQDGPVTLAVYDSRGRCVRRLLRDLHARSGPHVVTWEGMDDDRKPVASGTYYVRLQIPARTWTRRLILLQ